MLKLWCFLLAILFSIEAYSQPLGIDLLEGREKVEIPFELENGFIIIRVRINKTLPLKFIFDTGAEHTILFHKTLSDLMGLEYSKRIRIIGSDLSEELYALISRNIFIDLAGINSVRRDLLVLEKNTMILEETIGIRLDGILGGSFFRGLVLDIDYKKKRITLYEPTRYEPPSSDKYKIFDILIKENKPYLNTSSVLTTGDTINTILLIDTGAALPFLLHTNTDSSLVMPHYVIRGNIGQGMGGIILGFLGKIDKLIIGDFFFNHILTSFQDIDLTIRTDKDLVRNGIMGNTLLERFHVIIDYFRSKLYLKANKNYNKEFGYDKSGLVIYAFGQNLDNFMINSVIPGSPAFEADIRAGDVITKFCGRKAKHWSLKKIHDKLSRENGKCIKLIIERGGETIKKKFYLRDLLLEKNLKPLTRA